MNRKLFTEAAILSITATVERIRSGEVKLNDWFIPEIMDFDSWSYNFNISKFVRINSP